MRLGRPALKKLFKEGKKDFHGVRVTFGNKTWRDCLRSSVERRYSNVAKNNPDYSFHPIELYRFRIKVFEKCSERRAGGRDENKGKRRGWGERTSFKS